MERITSESNKKIKKIKKLMDNPRFRKKEGLFVVEGARIVNEAVKREAAVEIFIDESNNPLVYDLSGDIALNKLNNCSAKADSFRFDLNLIFVPVTAVSSNIFKELSNTINSQGIIAICKSPENFDLSKFCVDNKKAPLLLLLDGIQDPGNLGTIVRSSLGADVDGLVLSKNSVDMFNPKVLRSTMGAVFDLDYCYVDSLPEVIEILKNKGFNIYATLPEESKAYYDFDYKLPTAIIIGNEANGISEEVKKLDINHITIPMANNLESLNAAVAASVVLYEVARQRR
ncbi:MAG: RNA methyltransferase [Lachnospiraceae bacterium]|nr:RNA methyltransferase [Lachnospiraceae bacterium]